MTQWGWWEMMLSELKIDLINIRNTIPCSEKGWLAVFPFDFLCVIDSVMLFIILILTCLIMFISVLLCSQGHAKACVSCTVCAFCKQHYRTLINLFLFLSGILTFGWRGIPLCSHLISRWKFQERRSPTTLLTFTQEKYTVSTANVRLYKNAHAHQKVHAHIFKKLHGNFQCLKFRSASCTSRLRVLKVNRVVWFCI